MTGADPEVFVVVEVKIKQRALTALISGSVVMLNNRIRCATPVRTNTEANSFESF